MLEMMPLRIKSCGHAGIVGGLGQMAEGEVIVEGVELFGKESHEHWAEIRRHDFENLHGRELRVMLV